MIRALVTILCVTVSVACGNPSPNAALSGDSSEHEVAVATSPTPLDSTIAALSIELAPFEASIRALPARLRPYSGTDVADSVLLDTRQALERQLRSIETTFNDSLFQVMIWPEGSHGFRQSRRLQQSGQPERPADPLAPDSLRRFLLARGVWSYQADGEMYFAPSLDRLIASADSFITNAGRQALRIERREQLSPTGGDASVAIPWDSLGERLAAADHFLARFPDARAAAVIKRYRDSYLRAFLTGWDNTAVFDHRSRTLRPDVRRSFEDFVLAHDTTTSAKVVRAYLELLAHTQYRRTPEVDIFLRTRSGIPPH